VPRILQPELPPPSEAALVESVVAASLFRAVERDLIEAFGMPGTLFYWRSKKGNEIDFLAGTRAHRVPIEVRYQATISGYDRRAIQQAFRRGILLSRSQLDLGGPVPVLPASVFLWMLKEESPGDSPHRLAPQ
jgi:predicted AAA+ superfamily ATPase